MAFNASHPKLIGISLNEFQMVGEKLQGDSAITLICFRMHKIALCAVVKQMHCPGDDHRKFQKILWRKSCAEPVGVYVSNRVAYGQTNALFLSVHAMQQCAREYEKQFSNSAECILEDFYSDNLPGLSQLHKIPSQNGWISSTNVDYRIARFLQCERVGM